MGQICDIDDLYTELDEVYEIDTGVYETHGSDM